MRRTSFAEMNCSVAGTLEVVGEWWTFLVLRDAFLGVRRFEDFQRRLGIARNVLAARLQTLVRHGILERRQYLAKPERYEYRLTERGLELHPILVSLMQWGDRWARATVAPPMELIHSGCGQRSRPLMVCDRCGESVHPQDVQPVTGPGWDESEEPPPHVIKAEAWASGTDQHGAGRSGA